MKYLPIENIIYKTHLKEDEIIKRLSENIEPIKVFRFNIFKSGSSKPYEGSFNGITFNIYRIIKYQNSFQPRINGVIENDFEGLRIKVKMRLNIFVIIFLFLWFGGVFLGFIGMLVKSFNNSEFEIAILIPLGMLLFAYALTMGGFKYESNKSKKDLQTILEADLIAHE